MEPQPLKVWLGNLLPTLTRAELQLQLNSLGWAPTDICIRAPGQGGRNMSSSSSPSQFAFVTMPDEASVPYPFSLAIAIDFACVSAVWLLELATVRASASELSI